jgi:hypothetical protein
MTAEASWVEEFRVYRALRCFQIPSESDIYHTSGSVTLQNGSGGNFRHSSFPFARDQMSSIVLLKYLSISELLALSHQTALLILKSWGAQHHDIFILFSSLCK